MATYIITYDLSVPGRKYPDLHDRIKGYRDCVQITESSWAVKTNATAKAIRDNLKGTIDANDKLFVAVLTAPAASYRLGTKVSDWLKRSL